jgi:hypothetical protein
VKIIPFRAFFRGGSLKIININITASQSACCLAVLAQNINEKVEKSLELILQLP